MICIPTCAVKIAELSGMQRKKEGSSEKERVMREGLCSSDLTSKICEQSSSKSLYGLETKVSSRGLHTLSDLHIKNLK